VDDELILMLIARRRPDALLDLHWIGVVDPAMKVMFEKIVQADIPTSEKYKKIYGMFEAK
jgi:hypothetical protein